MIEEASESILVLGVLSFCFLFPSPSSGTVTLVMLEPSLLPLMLFSAFSLFSSLVSEIHFGIILVNRLFLAYSTVKSARLLIQKLIHGRRSDRGCFCLRIFGSSSGPELQLRRAGVGM